VGSSPSPPFCSTGGWVRSRSGSGGDGLLSWRRFGRLAGIAVGKVTLGQLGLMPSIKTKKKKKTKKRRETIHLLFFQERFPIFFFIPPPSFLTRVSEQLGWPGAGRGRRSLSSPDGWWACVKRVITRCSAALRSRRRCAFLQRIVSEMRRDKILSKIIPDVFHRVMRLVYCVCY